MYSLSDKLDRILHWPGPSTHVAWTGYSIDVDRPTHVAWTGYSIDVDRPTHVAWTRYSIDVDRPTHVAWTGFTRQLYIAVYFLIYVVHKLSTFTALHRGGGGSVDFFSEQNLNLVSVISVIMKILLFHFRDTH